jgi:hypothetical protein
LKCRSRQTDGGCRDAIAAVTCGRILEKQTLERFDLALVW